MGSCLMGVLALTYSYIRAGVLRRALGVLNIASIISLKVVQETCNKYNLVTDYQQRPHMNDIFKTSVEEVGKAFRTTESIKANDLGFCRFLGPLFVGIHIATNGLNVINQKTSLGLFLATIAVYREFSVVY